MSGLSATLIVWAAFGPCRAPVPAAPAPDPGGRGYLGIYFVATPGNDSLAVDRVVENMPAAKAGVRAGDVIVRVNSLRPAGTQEMIAHVMAYRPGAVVELEVRRGDEQKAFRVRLAARPETPDTGYPVPGLPLPRP